MDDSVTTGEADAADMSSLPYHEPGIVTILIISSFLILLNVINKLLDAVLYCGLVGQVLVGITWGTPGAQWLDTSIEQSITQLGYLGLILLVFEGGLSTSFTSLKQNFMLSTCVAVTGIAVPVGLSFVLLGLSNASPLKAFAAGAALCSTSLGTTFTILRTSGLIDTRLGTVLTSAAMMDDVVGLVMVQVIGDLGASTSGFDAETVARPIGVSIAAVVVLCLLCRFLVKPITSWILSSHFSWITFFKGFLTTSRGSWVLQTAVLLVFIAAASYAGTSVLFAAYLAGAASNWWFSVFSGPWNQTNVPLSSSQKPQRKAEASHSQPGLSSSNENGSCFLTPPSGTQASSESSFNSTRSFGTKKNANSTSVYSKYYHAPVETVLKPFFFASIGFSIPITRMFVGRIVWRGIIYSILMHSAKLLTGAWLIHLPTPAVLRSFKLRNKSFFRRSDADKSKAGTEPKSPDPAPTATSENANLSNPNDVPASGPPSANQSRPRAPSRSSRQQAPEEEPSEAQHVSLYPSAILGCAMVARGEIGFLIASTANSNGIFGLEASEVSEVYLVVIWAIVLCTVIGPVMTGVLFRRVKRLQVAERGEGSNERPDPLGVWGIELRK